MPPDTEVITTDNGMATKIRKGTGNSVEGAIRVVDGEADGIGVSFVLMSTICDPRCCIAR